MTGQTQNKNSHNAPKIHLQHQLYYNSMQGIISQTLVRVAAYYMFWQEWKQCCERQKYSVFNWLCRPVADEISYKNLSLDKISINPCMPLQRL